MAKIKKKGTSGQAKNYITRTQAVRKLQISLPDFRRLCIFKGIYPREPRSKKKAAKNSTPSTTFYYTKDIQYLLHEPLLKKFRDQKAVAKKIARSLGRGEVGDAARLEKNNAPKLSLDHVIKERYPTFTDALRDLDDALSLLFLFASLPSTAHVPPKTIALCQRLCHEFQHYLIVTNSLRKSFLSIKGIYYQATVQGQDILWLVPYRFVQRVNGDVDYRIMATFVEFYTTLLGFVNFRLYSTIGLVYPPRFNTRSDENGAELAAFTLEGRHVGEAPKEIESGAAQQRAASASDQTAASEIQGRVDEVIKVAGLDQGGSTEENNNKSNNNNNDGDGDDDDDDDDDAIDKFEPAAPEADMLPQPELNANQAASLFAPFTFYISREAPRGPLEFILRAFGCKRIGWDAVLGDGAFTHDELDPRITHQIVDRPPLPESSLPAAAAAAAGKGGADAAARARGATRVPGRNYVQPQWVWDCINEGKLLRADLYAPGATLPPHLSPWVKPSKGAYDPRASLAEQQEEGEEELTSEEEDEENDGGAVQAVQSSKTAGPAAADEDDDDDDDESVDGGMDVAGTDDEDSSEVDDDDDEEEEEEEEEENAEDPGLTAEAEDMALSDSEDEQEAVRAQHQKELEAEAAGLPFSSANGSSTGPAKTKPKTKTLAAKKRREEEELERQKMMMSRKKRKLLEKMVYSNKKQAEEAAKLRSKRRKLEKASHTQ